MNKELVIDADESEITIALLEDKKLVEITREKSNKSFSVGDLYLGRVKKIMPGLNAAFVDVGYEKDAFLHYLDLGPQFSSLNKYVKQSIQGKLTTGMLYDFTTEPDIKKDGKITDQLRTNDHVLVQIAKEPISSKGPRITTELSLAGRYLVLVPFSDKISVSQKIKDPEEKDRLKKLIAALKPKNFGVIIRTVAEGKKVNDVEADLNELVARWKECHSVFKSGKPPRCVLGEIDRTQVILRDMLNADFNSVNTGSDKIYNDVRQYITTIAPDKKDIVKLYKNKVPIFDHFSVNKQIKALFGKTVNLRSGGYLIIEHTEALHVIDVNSGHRKTIEGDQENNALLCNLEAATEIARQLRLRDMGGIIVIDFIDMHNPANRKQLFDRLRNEMDVDRAKHNILPPSKFGLVQVTRQRVRPETNIDTYEKCPTCDGTGQIQPPILAIDEIENNLRYLIKDQNESKLKLFVHPYLHAFLTKGFLKSLQWKWFWKYKKWVPVKPLPAYHLLQYSFTNSHDEEIKL